MPDDLRLRRVAHWQDTVVMPAYATREAWLARAAEVREQVLFAAGLLPLPERTPLYPMVAGRQERDGYAVENVAFESFPGFFCTGNLYRPLTPGPHPVVLTPHGHWQEGRFAQRENGSIPARCISFARQGYLTFAPDMVGYNDSQQVVHRGFDSPTNALWGIGALGLQLWNNIRALDYLLSLPEADASRVACTGESGGATQTYLLAAVDDRVRVVAPVNMLSAHYAGGCVCENAPGLRLGLTNMELVAAAAPRPMLIVAATGDWTVNTPRVEYPAVRGIYELLGAADRLECVQFDAPHNYNLDSRQAVYGFLARHVGGRAASAPRSEKEVFRAGQTEPLAEAPGAVIEDVEPLRVFAGRNRPAEWAPLDPGSLKNTRWRAVLSSLPRDADGVLRFRDLYGPALRRAIGAIAPAADEVLVRERPHSHPAAERQPHVVSIDQREIGTRSHGERIPAALVRPATADPAAVPVVLVHPGGRAAVLNDEGGGPEAAPAANGDPRLRSPLLKELVDAGRTVLVPDLFLTGEYLSPIGRAGRPTSEAHFTTYNRTDAMWRAQDVLTACVALRALTAAQEVDVVGLGEAGPVGLLARAAAPELIRRLIADACAAGWADEELYLDRLYVPHLPRLGGLVAAVALAAPAPLYLFNTGDQAHEPLRFIYHLAGAPDALQIEHGPPPGA
jgi:dienelactone hydrolase